MSGSVKTQFSSQRAISIISVHLSMMISQQESLPLPQLNPSSELCHLGAIYLYESVISLPKTHILLLSPTFRVLSTKQSLSVCCFIEVKMDHQEESSLQLNLSRNRSFD